uniref:Photosystem I reaction center subunit XI n=1 Tax=Sciadococcus taiwanensis TaxID=3028030 RepID=A0A9Y1I250_9RHOD|nr:photosystem I subunit XI [Sciadococcus taiwanensis]
MTEYVKPYNEDPFVGNLATPINTSSFTKGLLSNLPAYRRGLSPLLRGLEIGMAHGYFLIGPFYKLGPLRNSDVSLLSGLLSSIGLIIFMTIGMLLYGSVSFEKSDTQDQLQTSEGWTQLASGFFVGAIGGAGFAYLLLANTELLPGSSFLN